MSSTTSPPARPVSALERSLVPAVVVLLILGTLFRILPILLG